MPIKAEEEVRDSVKVKEVVVTASRKKHFSDGYQYNELSGIITSSYSNRTLGEVLHQTTNINIRSYGSPGASTSISFRGLSASQTQVNWNGFPINSVTLGSADVSNVMMSPGNAVSMAPGAGGVTYGSGTFGGVVDIDYRAKQQVENNAAIDLMIGAFDTYKARGGYNANHHKLSLNGNVWYEKSDADFDYFDEIKQKKLKRHNADYQQLGFQQYFSYKPNAYAEIKGGIWGQIKDMNIPAIEGASLTSYENQKDSTLRLFLNYKQVFNRSAITIKGAWFYTDQHYVKKNSINAEETMIDSRIKSKAWFGDFNYRVYLTDFLSLDAGATYNHTKGIVDAYNGMQYDEVFGVVGGLRYVNVISANIAFRKDWSNNVDSDILLNAGVSYPITKQFMVRGAFSQKIRRPTFNDLFWVPGGNPDLKPEEGYSVELGGNYIIDVNHAGTVTADLSFYYSPVENMIVWRPEGALWYAKNYSDVLTRGIDFKIKHEKDYPLLSWQTNISLGYNKATIQKVDDESNAREGKPLYYAPTWLSNINSQIVTHNNYEFLLSWNFVSDQYYDDSDYTLDPYWLFNAHVSKTFKINKHQLIAQASVDNILDKRYQTVRSYPMPGRMWNLKVKYIFK